tara:strand:- start:533 stop:1147 length:615 start_codon:yes stop_codon:yes gene_type:complete
MAYIGTQPNNVKKNTGLYTPSEILQLTKDGSWGGSLELIEDKTISSVTSFEFTNLLENVYDVHLFQWAGIEWSGGNDTMSMRVSNDNGSTYESTSKYSYATQLNGVGGNTSESKRTDHTSYDRLAQQLQNACHNGYLYMYNAGNSSLYTSFTQQLNGTSVTANYYDFRYGSGAYTVTETINAIKFFTGTYAMTGNMKLFGVKKI